MKKLKEKLRNLLEGKQIAGGIDVLLPSSLTILGLTGENIVAIGTRSESFQLSFDKESVLSTIKENKRRDLKAQNVDINDSSQVADFVEDKISRDLDAEVSISANAVNIHT